MIYCRRSVVIITIAQLHTTNPELKRSESSNPARGVSEICDGEDLLQWSLLEIKLNAFRRLTIPQKQYININELPHELSNYLRLRILEN